MIDIDPKAKLGMYPYVNMIIKQLADDCGLTFFEGMARAVASLDSTFISKWDRDDDYRYDLIVYEDWRNHISMDIYWGNNHHTEGISLSDLNYEGAKNKILEGIQLINYNKKQQRKLEITGATKGYKV